MSSICDGPVSLRFTPLPLKGNANLAALAASAEVPAGLPPDMRAALPHAPEGECVAWGIPFQIGEVILLDRPVTVQVPAVRARWLVFLHTAARPPIPPGEGTNLPLLNGPDLLGEPVANYSMLYEDGSRCEVPIRGRRQIGAFQRNFGENGFECVAQHKPGPMPAAQEQPGPPWGWTQTRALSQDEGPWVNWLWAWENPEPHNAITGFCFEPGSRVVILSAITAGEVASLPLRWRPRRKACLSLPAGEPFDPTLDGDGLLKAVQLDLGQVISATPRLAYPNGAWQETENNTVPEVSAGEILIEYTSHPEACFHIFTAGGERIVPVAEVEAALPQEIAPQEAASQEAAPREGVLSLIRPVAPAERLVRVRVVERASRRPVAAKLHIHGEAGEYLPPVDRHRIINPFFFEDYSVDFTHILDWSARARHHDCTYINGETRVRLPVGRVYVEVSKGFEIRPQRRVVEVGADSDEILVEVEKVLPWRERGWVTADTHVHFLSPASAGLEGAAEGVNVVNLLASQWGELMTSVGDFDGRSTWGAKEFGGGPQRDGEYLVRVGSENRQHVLGHISLLGYQGPLITPLTTGGPDESALGDPLETLMLEWAQQCRRQGGLVVLPHHPLPRAEGAAVIVNGDADAVEMTSWSYLYAGLNPYALLDWYRYLNCGYQVPVVGGTDKMAAMTAVGTVRTYAHLADQLEFSYENWKEAVRRGETFVTYGPLLEFMVNGHPMGGRLDLPAGGGALDVTWEAASVTLPMTQVELVVNGEVCESQAIAPTQAAGHWTVRAPRSAWLALRVRGHYPGKPEILAAHTSPVMVRVEGSPLFSATEAATILEQIEGSLAYLDTVGPRADEASHQRMRRALAATHRKLHERLQESRT